MSRNVSIIGAVAAVVVATLAMVSVAFAAQQGGGQEKATLCHNGHTITVGAPAQAAHERLGDTLGDCPTDAQTTEPAEDSTTPETTTEDTTTADATTPDTEADDDQYGRGQEKVTLCHNGHTITVGAPAQAAHERHGDTLGACPTDAPEATDQGGETTAVAGDEAANDPQGGTDLYGDSAANRLVGTPHEDFLQSGRGPDTMFGSPGNDYLDGADGISGNDIIDGGQGIDRCVGDRGDTFRYCDGNVVQIPVPPAATP